MDQPQKFTITLGTPEPDDVQKRDDVKFRAALNQIIQESEDLRIKYMQKQKFRKNTVAIISFLSVSAGAGGFGYFFLFYGLIYMAISSVLLSFILPAILPFWADLPLKKYKKAYKQEFLPKLAKALGGLSYFPSRGISEKIVRKTGVLPEFDTYKAEDCFMGKYKGVKVLLSEARLYRKRQKKAVFDGVFVLMEIPSAVIEGHTIITADMEAANQWSISRWKNFQQIKINLEDEQSNRFVIFSDTPEAAQLMVGERLLKELAEASMVFKNALLSTVLFHKKYIFMAIPYDGDMFEPSDVASPVTAKHHAEHTKSEIDKLLEIIDVFELYDTAVNI